MTLNEWVRQLEEQETPVFRQTALEVAEIAANPDSGADALAHLIQRDPMLTAKVLKLSNSAFYNPSGKPIQTVSRALLLLGMERVQAICMSVALVETMQSGKRLDRVRRELARSILAAVLARTLGLETLEGALDEIFVAALLRRIGPMLFWSSGGEEATTLDGVLRASGDDPATERAVLGFQLAHISLLLAEQWKLSSLLVELLRGRSGSRPARAVLHGWETAQALLDGWGSERAHQGIQRVATYLKIDGSQATLLVAAATREARSWAREIGADPICAFLPEPPPPGKELDNLYVEREPSTVVSTPDSIRIPRLALTLQGLAEVAVVTDLHRLPAIVLDGLHIGLGMDRALFAVYLPATGEIRCRHAVGEGADSLMQNWRFTMRLQMADSLSRAMERNLPLAFDPLSKDRLPSLPETLDSFLGGVAFLFLPVRVQGRLMGAFCADRGPSRRSLDAAAQEGFRILCSSLEETIARVRPD